MSTKQNYDILQKGLSDTYGLKIDDEGVFYYSKDFKNSTELYFTFAEIAERKKVRFQTVTQMNAFWYIPMIIIVVICLSMAMSNGGTIITNLVGIATFIFALLSNWIFMVKNVCVPIEQGGSISYMYFFDNIPFKSSGDEIVEKIYKARAINYKDRYFRIYESNDKDTELGRMEWLFREKIISKAEYEMMVELINDAFNYEEE
jgi:hypothetical protein